jgi:hypothetical protein
MTQQDGGSMASKSRSALVGLADEQAAQQTALATAGRTVELARAKRGSNDNAEAGTTRASGRKLTFNYPIEVHRGLKSLAAEEDTTLQALVGEAIDMLMRNRGKHPFGAR